MTKLELLYAEKIKKFDEICALVARELGYGELSTMNGEGRNRMVDERSSTLSSGKENELKCELSLTIRPITPRRRLLGRRITTCCRRIPR